MEKKAKICFVEGINKDYLKAEINGVTDTYEWNIMDIAQLRDRIESAGIEAIEYSGRNVFKGCPMVLDRVNTFVVKLAEMV